MEIFNVLSSDIYNLMLIIATFAIVNKTSSKKEDNWFKYLIILLFFSVISKLMSEYPVNDAILGFIAYTGTYLLYIIAPIIGCFILKYANSCMDYANGKSNMLFAIYAAISVLNFAILTISQIFSLGLFYNFIGTRYYKGCLYNARTIIIGLEYISLQLYIIYASKKSKWEFSPALWLFPIYTVSISTLHLYTGRVTHDYTDVLFYSILLYMYMQSRDINIDFLTGTVNRRKFDAELTKRVHNGDIVKFSGIMVDIDRFKAINDNYGHQAGDDALTAFSSIVLKNFRKTDIVARYGGDEFCILTDICDEDKIRQTIAKLKNNVETFNASHKLPFSIFYSIGYAIYDNELDGSSSAFLKRLDESMYKEKEIHHKEIDMYSNNTRT